MGDELLIEFCRARERLREAEQELRDERAEQNDAQRTLGNLLRDSMQKSEAACVELPSDGARKFVRLVSTKRCPPLKSDEEVLGLVDDVARHMTDVPREGMPDAVVGLVKARLRKRGEDAAPAKPPRVTITSQPPRRGTPILAPAGEIGRLSKQFSQAVEERQKTQSTLKPLREAVREAEQSLLPRMPAEGASLHMQRREGGGPPVTLKVERREVGSGRKADPLAAAAASGGATPNKARLGAREVTGMVREAVVEWSGDRESLDVEIRAHMTRQLRERRPAPPKPARLHVRRLKAGDAAPASV